MAYKTLLCVLDDSADAAGRLQLAVGMAGRLEAHLVGLMVIQPPSLPPYVEDQLPPEVLLQQKDRADAALDRVGAMFEHACAQAGVTGEWRTGHGTIAQIAALHARYADLAICGAVPRDIASYGTVANLPEDLVLLTGGPVLVVPTGYTGDRVGSRVVVGWDASREAARAIWDGMTLLEGADRTLVISANPRKGSWTGSHGEDPGADLAVVLARHGATVETRTVTENKGAAQILEDAVQTEDADLLIIGGYGHSRVREMVLGGVTRHILANPPVPVLMSH